MSGQYLIAREGEQSGPYTLDQIQQMQAAGQLFPSDMAWTEGQADWLPLSQITDNLPPSAPPPPSTEEAQKTGKSTLVVRIILGIFLVAALVIAGLSWRAYMRQKAAYDRLDEMRNSGTKNTIENFHITIGREPDTSQKQLETVTEIYIWNGIIRKHRITVKYFQVDAEKKTYEIFDVNDRQENSQDE